VAGKKKACSQHTQSQGCNTLREDAPSHTPDCGRVGKGFSKEMLQFVTALTATLNCSVRAQPIPDNEIRQQFLVAALKLGCDARQMILRREFFCPKVNREVTMIFETSGRHATSFEQVSEIESCSGAKQCGVLVTTQSGDVLTEKWDQCRAERASLLPDKTVKFI